MVRRTRKTKRRQVAKAAMLAIRYAARPIRRRTRTRGGEKQTRKITRDPTATQRWEEWKRRPPRSDGTLRAPPPGYGVRGDAEDDAEGGFLAAGRSSARAARAARRLARGQERRPKTPMMACGGLTSSPRAAGTYTYTYTHTYTYTYAFLEDRRGRSAARG